MHTKKTKVTGTEIYEWLVFLCGNSGLGIFDSLSTTAISATSIAPPRAWSRLPAADRDEAATRYDTIRYDTRCYFNVQSKAGMSQLNLPHGTNN